jgi:hypothetical protein
MTQKMKNFKTLFLTLGLSTILFTSCTIEETSDLNQPDLNVILNNPKVGQLNELVTGILASASSNLNTHYDVAGIIGREIYRFDVSDPRFVGDLLGTGNLDNSAFYTNNSFSARYVSVKLSNTLIEAAQNNDVITDEQEHGYLAFANALKAYELLNALGQQWDNGIRIDVADPTALGPFTANASEALTAVSDILAEAVTHNNQAGEAFLFELTSGFAGFDTPVTFGKFIRALQARVEIYRGNWTQALTFVDQSFIDETGNFDLGVYRVFSTATGDRINPLFFPKNTNGTTRLAHPSFIADAVPGDDRLAKASARTAPISSTGLTATHDAFRYASQTTDIPIIRNEELILIKAEALIQTNQFAAAKTLIDKIRVDVAGIGAYAGPLTQPAMIDEMLFQRRYSLWEEGHRWIDLRRYNRLDTLPLDRAGDSVIKELPRPFNEVGVQGG